MPVCSANAARFALLLKGPPWAEATGANLSFPTNLLIYPPTKPYAIEAAISSLGRLRATSFAIPASVKTPQVSSTVGVLLDSRAFFSKLS